MGATLKEKIFPQRERFFSFKYSPYDKAGKYISYKIISIISNIFYTHTRNLRNGSYAYEL